MASQYKGSKVGFPIRKSSDQSSFAAPQGLSQRTTSFIASQRQGIHRMLLRHLIALMINVRNSSSKGASSGGTAPRQRKKQTIRKTGLSGSSAQKTMLAKHLRRQNGLCTAPARRAKNRRWPTPQKEPATGHVPSSRFQISAPRPHLQGHEREVFDRTCKNQTSQKAVGGARRDRTDDLKLAKLALSQLSYGPWPQAKVLGIKAGTDAVRLMPGTARRPFGLAACSRPTDHIMVGLGRLERPTSPLSGVRSNHLSYRPCSCPPTAPNPSRKAPRGCSGMSSEIRETKTATSRQWGLDRPRVFQVIR